MDTLQIISLALMQGLTEFLPISSSAHLILAPLVLGYSDQGLAFDVAVHVGTLAAVLAYFRSEVGGILRDVGRQLLGGGTASANARLGWLIVLATIPVGVGGLLLKHAVETDLRSPMVIAVTTIGFGLLLWVFDRRGRKTRSENELRWSDALIIGMFQAVALIPGTSRSGITITAGLMLGLSRRAASRFSFLLSIPTISLSGLLVTADLLSSDGPVEWRPLVIGAVLSFATAYLCIHYFLAFIERIGMLPFVVYRLILGALILLIIV